MADCVQVVATFTVPEAALAEQLPSEYTVLSEVSGVGRLNLDAWSCGSLVLDNRTLLPNVRLVSLTTFVIPPESVDAGRDDAYVFAWYTDSRDLQEALGMAGFEVHGGDINVMVGAQDVEIQIIGEDGVSVSLSMVRPSGAGGSESRSQRFHHEGLVWADRNQSAEPDAVVGPAVMALAGTPLETIAPGGRFAGIAEHVSAAGSLEFGP